MSDTTNQTQNKKAVAYLRANTNGPSLSRQRLEILKYAFANNIQIIKWFEDVAKSPKNINRPGLQGLIKLATRNEQKIDYVLVQQISRLSRDTHTFHVGIMSKLGPRNISIRSVTEGFDETPQGQLQQQICLSIAQLSNNYKRTM